MFRDEMIDLALFVMILGMVVSVGLGLAVRTEKKARNDSQISAEDKNTRKLRGYNTDEQKDFNGTLSREDAVLMMQVQDYYIPAPKRITVIDANGVKTVINIESNYKDSLEVYGANMFNCLKDDKPDTEYELTYDKGLLANDKTDDTYVLSKKVE